jgi:hypothetical protein
MSYQCRTNEIFETNWAAFSVDERRAQIRRETHATHGDQIGEMTKLVICLTAYSTEV